MRQNWYLITAATRIRDLTQISAIQRPDTDLCYKKTWHRPVLYKDLTQTCAVQRLDTDLCCTKTWNRPVLYSLSSKLCMVSLTLIRSSSSSSSSSSLKYQHQLTLQKSSFSKKESNILLGLTMDKTISGPIQGPTWKTRGPWATLLTRENSSNQ